MCGRGGLLCSKTCENLKAKGLNSIMMVETAHKLFPRYHLSRQKASLKPGEFVLREQKSKDLLAIRYQDKKQFEMTASCSTTLPRKPRTKIRRNGEKVMIPRPAVVSEYFDHADAIDVYNHIRTGQRGLEDTWRSQSPMIRQFSGLQGFIETNAYQAMKCFGNVPTLAHYEFRENLANELITNKLDCEEKLDLRRRVEAESYQHRVGKLEKQAKCFYCSHSGQKRIRSFTKYYCTNVICGPKQPLCSHTTGRTCFEDHIIYGFPAKKYRNSD